MGRRGRVVVAAGAALSVLPLLAATGEAADRPRPAPPAAASLRQDVVLTVKGGAFSLGTGEATVVLHRQGGRYRGALGPVDVVDARGSLAGWEARATVVEVVAVAGDERAPVEDAAVRVAPRRPAVVDGDHRGVLPAPAAVVGVGETTALGRARPGWGGGTYAVAATVDAAIPGGADRVEVRISLAGP